MFGLFKAKAKEAANKFAGQTDFLEAVCAGAALIASADGSIGDDEIVAAVKAVKANPALSGGFSDAQIEACIEKMLSRAGGGRVGRAGLWKEIEEVKADAEKGQYVILAAADVADQGGIGDDEKRTLIEIGNKLGLNAKSIASL